MALLFHDEAAALLADALGVDADAVRAQLAAPPKPDMGDLGFPCFALAKERKQAPPLIAKEIAAKIALPPDGPFAVVAAAGPYVNFTYALPALARATVVPILASPETWGRTDEGRGRTVVIDFSSPNIAKPLGVHHIRSTMIGAALARLYAAGGWHVIRVNYLGDWGTTFGQLAVAYARAREKDPDHPVDVQALLKLYVAFHAAAEEDESLADDARAWFKRLEDGDADARALWRTFVDESLKPLKKLYERLGVDFDRYDGESKANDRMDELADRLDRMGLLAASDGAKVVDLEAEGMPPLLVRKRDGATTYATRDLVTAEYRHDDYKADRILYVVANQQELHFRQVFTVLAKMGHAWAEGCAHVKFGMLAFGAGVFGEGQATGSTRKGKVVFLEDVLDRAVAKARAILAENARDADLDLDALAEQVGVGAVVFSEFIQRRQKDVLFTWEKALNWQGDSGPYLQYTHARLSTVRRKYASELPAPADIPWGRLTSPLEKEALAALAGFPGAVAAARRDDEPSWVATYLLDLAAVFNRFFTDKEHHRILSDDAELTVARVGLAEAVRLTLEQGLRFLGLQAPDRM